MQMPVCFSLRRTAPHILPLVRVPLFHSKFIRRPFVSLHRAEFDFGPSVALLLNNRTVRALETFTTGTTIILTAFVLINVHQV